MIFGFGKKKEEIKIEENTTTYTDNKEEQEPIESAVTIIEDTNKTVEETEEEITVSSGKKKPKKQIIELSEPQEIPLTYKELKSLKKARYDEIAPKFKNVFVLKNKKTGQIAEIRAASSFHACNIIGWRKNRVQVIQERSITKEEEIEINKIKEQIKEADIKTEIKDVSVESKTETITSHSSSNNKKD